MKKILRMLGKNKMPNPIQKIIALAIKNGYVPEKKKQGIDNFGIENALNSFYDNKLPSKVEIRAYIYNLKYKIENQAIDSYNLEKVIELAYEKGIEETLKQLYLELETYPAKMWKLNDGKLPYVIWQGKADEVEKFHLWRTGITDVMSIVKRLLTNLSPNKED